MKTEFFVPSVRHENSQDKIPDNMKQNILDNSKLDLLEVWKDYENNNRIIKKQYKTETHKKQNNAGSSL